MNKKENYREFKLAYEDVCEYLGYEDDSVDEQKLNDVLIKIDEKLASLLDKYQNKISSIILVEFYMQFINVLLPKIKNLNEKCKEAILFPPVLLNDKLEINRGYKKIIQNCFKKYNYRELRLCEAVPQDLIEIVNTKDVFLEKNEKHYPNPSFDHDINSWMRKEIKVMERTIELLKSLPPFYKEEIEEILFLLDKKNKLNSHKELFLSLSSNVDGIFLMADTNMEIFFEKKIGRKVL